MYILGGISVGLNNCVVPNDSKGGTQKNRNHMPVATSLNFDFEMLCVVATFAVSVCDRYRVLTNNIPY